MAYSGSSGAYAPKNDEQRQKSAGYQPRASQQRGAPPEKQSTSFFARRSVAAVVAALLILGSTFFSVNRTLGEKCQEVTDTFYSGVVYDGYTHPSISSQLDICANTANGLVTLAANHPELEEQTQAVRDCRESLMAILEHVANGDKGYSVSDVSASYKNLTSAVSALSAGLEASELTEREQSGLTQYMDTFSGAQGVIEKAGYNEAVREFMRTTMNVFPANYLGRFANVDAPDLFT